MIIDHIGLAVSDYEHSKRFSAATVAALVDSLRYDPFYVAITEEFAADEALRRQALGSILRLLDE